MRIGQPRVFADRTHRQTSFNAMDPVLAERARTDAADSRRTLRLAVVLGIALHAVLFAIVFPAPRTVPREIGGGHRLYAIRQLRFAPPPPARRTAEQTAKPKAKRIPIPDPTPDEPEPIVDEFNQSTDVEFPEVTGGDVVDVPAGPSGPGVSVYQVSGNVMPPVKIHAPEPVYPEEARLGHVQGVVILQTIIDADGNVTDIRVLKGLPSGLTEAAVAAVSQWRFRPATLEGKPVAVHYLVTISFSVQ